MNNDVDDNGDPDNGHDPISVWREAMQWLLLVAGGAVACVLVWLIVQGVKRLLA